MAYKEPFYIDASTKIRAANAKLTETQSKFAVVRHLGQEMGMVSEAAINEVLDRIPKG